MHMASLQADFNW